MARPDAKTLKARKQKKMAIILSVFLLALMAISIPKTMGLMKQLNGTPPAAAAAAAPVPAPGAPTPATPGTAPADAGAAALASAAAPTLKEATAPEAEDGQLVSFGRFTSKDPFVQQVGATPAPGSAKAAVDAPAADVKIDVKPKKDAPPLELPPVPAEGGTTSPEPPAAEPATPQPPALPTAATISVNGGLEELVRPDGNFPALDPIFTLVSVSKAGARIAIADGSYESGAETILLTVGKPLTLMNTADGTRYEILLVSLS